MILVQPFVIYLIIISFTSGALYTNKIEGFAFFVLLVSNLFLTGAFIAGWFFMAQKIIEHSKKVFDKKTDKDMASIAIIKQFFPGVGEYFLPISVFGFLYFALFILLIYTTYRIGLHFLPHPMITITQLQLASSSAEASKAFAESLSSAQLLTINYWILLISSVSFVYIFLTTFWPVMIINKTKNVVTALFESLKFTWKNFFSVLGILIFLSILNMLISFISLLGTQNLFITILSLILMFYFATYYLLLIFCFYDEKCD